MNNNRLFRPLSRILCSAASLLAIAVLGCGGSGTPSTPATPTAPAPTFSPAGGTYTVAPTVTITDSLAGTTIYYTLDGSRPSTASTVYSTPIALSTTTTVTAIAIETGYNNSASASATYSIAAPAPTFSPAAGTYTSIQTVSIADALSGATIYYTLDGSTPTTSSTKYTAAFSVSATTTVNAIAIGTGYVASSVASATYTINLPAAATPTFSPAGGAYMAAQIVTISDGTSGATIYYTTDGSTPTTGSLSMKSGGTITVSGSETVNAIAVATGYSTSALGTATYTLTVPTPTFSPGTGTYTSIQTVTISDALAGATIYYSTTGTATTSSTKYTGSFQVSTTETVSAIAVLTGFTNSASASATYTINLPAAPAPTFSPAGGTYSTVQTVSLADSVAGATIYYTTDGSQATTASKQYTAPFQISTTSTVNAIATATGYSTSAQASATYTLNFPAAATPTFAVVAGTYTSAQSVVISDATAGATIYYAINATATTSSPVYTPGTTISVSSSETISAIATATGYNNSAVATAAYTINLPTCGTPTFTPAAGTYTTIQTVTISDATAACSVYYTVDGSTPTTSSTKYTGAITVSSTETISAVAAASGYNTSAVGTATYTINLPTAATPTFSPVAGTYTTTQSVTLADTTAGVTIYYTIDGSTPTTSSLQYTGTAISVASTTSIKAIAVETGYLNSAVASATFTITPATVTVSVVLSTHDQTNLLAAQPSVTFATNTAIANQVVIDENQTFQSMDGFGASFTDSAAYLMEEVVPTNSQAGIFSDLFTRTGNGIGMSFMRLPMGATDLARNEYTFDDLSSGTDTSLNNFSIKHDLTYVLPFVLAAKTLNPSMKIMANPWSVPGWMKDSGSVNGGNLLSSMYTPFANYFVKYINAYASGGVPIDYISLQNEPLNNTTAYPSMYMDATTQTTVMRDYVMPAFTTAGITTKIFAYDHNWDNQAYPEQVLDDPTIAASPLIAGTAWHGYNGTPGAQQSVQNLFPTLGTWETEHSGGTFITDQFTDDFLEITQVLRNSAKGYIKWSLALDQTRGPNLTETNTGLGGCNTCSGVITVNNATGAVTKTVEYYTLGHYSKYVLPGAVRVYSSNGIYTNSAAFINPDGSRALIVYNVSSSTQTFQVQWGTKSFSYTLPGLGAATFVWSGAQTGTASLTATNEIQGSDYSSQYGLETEATGDTSGAYDLGYVTSNAYAAYNNVTFGTTSPTKVLVRSSSGGNGGTLEFHLDSRTGTLLGTATLPVTSGYQAYTTTTTSLVSTATGTHTVYIIFKGSGGIANLNWFQFQ